MATRVSVVIVAGVAIFALMFQSLSRQAETTAGATNSEVFNGTRAIFVDLVGTAGGQFPMLAVVAFIAGGLAFALILT
jgi:hypothetical protein